MTTPCIVVGGGPAGLAAAIETARAGVPTTLFEEGPLLAAKASRAQRERLLAEARTVEGKLVVRLNTPVLAVTSDREVLWGSGDHTFTTRAERLILATGARDKMALFRGWDLPGVLPAGAADFPSGARVLLAGSGPQLLSSARRLREAGCRLTAIVSAGGPPISSNAPPRTVWASEAVAEWDRIRREDTPVLDRHLLLSAEGASRVARVIVAPIECETGLPNPSRSITVEVDRLALTFDFVPDIALGEMAGCIVWLNGGTEFSLMTNDRGEAWTPGILGAGDLIEPTFRGIPEETGRIAGLTAAERLGALRAQEAEERRASIVERIAAADQPAGLLRSFDHTQWLGYLPQLADEIVVCPCEQVTMAQIRSAARTGAGTIETVKYRTRLGMGSCQGRECGPLCRQYMLAMGFSRTKSELVGSLNSRPPARPVTLGSLAQMRDEP